MVAGRTASNSSQLPGRLQLVTGASSAKEFRFDNVFGPAASQDEVYNDLAGPVVQRVLEGFNGAILAYGQTGTGKTHTMGILDKVADEHAGIIPRALSHMFGHATSDPDHEWQISVSFLQVYLESVHDLFAGSFDQRKKPAWDRVSRLAAGGGGGGGGGGGSSAASAAGEGDESLAIRQDPERGFYAVGAKEFVVRSFEEAVRLLNWGLDNRIIGSTRMNSTSSRSHTILTVHVKRRPRRGGDRPGGVVRGKLVAVDLAGSERVRRTTSRGTRLAEARFINQSLSALGNVISALADGNAAHVPYRDSKLTRLLQDVLDGRSNTCLLATLGPCRVDFAESLSTLQFASRCMRVQARPIQNKQTDYAALASKLQVRLASLEREFLAGQATMQQRYEHRLAVLADELQRSRLSQTQQGSTQPAVAIGAAASGNRQQHALLGHLDKSLTGLLHCWRVAESRLDAERERSSAESAAMAACDPYPDYKAATPTISPPEVVESEHAGRLRAVHAGVKAKLAGDLPRQHAADLIDTGVQTLTDVCDSLFADLLEARAEAARLRGDLVNQGQVVRALSAQLAATQHQQSVPSTLEPSPRRHPQQQQRGAEANGRRHAADPADRSQPRRAGASGGGALPSAVAEVEEGEEEEEDNDDDCIERILEARSSDGMLLYKVHWRGTDSSEDEWFRRDDLAADYPELTLAYEAAQRTTNGRRP